MMKTLALAAASTLVLGSAAMAQSSADAPTTVNPMPDAATTEAAPEAAPAPSASSGLPAIGSTPAAPSAADTSSNVSATAPSGLPAIGSAPAANPPGTVLAGTETVASAPVPDTRENRAKYGTPMSNAGKRSSASGN